MTFKQSVSTCFNKYATFSGRASRSEYWYFQLFLFIGGFITGFLDGIIGTHSALSSIFSLITLLPAIAVTTRRLHDIGKSGWWQLWMGMIVIAIAALAAILFAATDTITGSDMASVGFIVVLVAGTVVTSLIWLYWLTKKSDYETNRFGPPPWEVDNFPENS